MVSESYTFAPLGDYSSSATNAEYTKLQKLFMYTKVIHPIFGSSQPVNHVSFVNGSGPGGGSKKPAEKGFATKGSCSSRAWKLYWDLRKQVYIASPAKIEVDNN